MILKCFGWLMLFLLKKIRVVHQNDLYSEFISPQDSLMRYCCRNKSKKRGYTGMVYRIAGDMSYYTFYLKGIETANKYSLYANGQVRSLQLSFCSYLLYSQSYFVNGCLKSENYQFACGSMKYFIKLYLPTGRVYFEGYEIVALVVDRPQVLLYDYISNPVTGRIYYLNDEGCVTSSRLYQKGIRTNTDSAII